MPTNDALNRREFALDLALHRLSDGSPVDLASLFKPSTWSRCASLLRPGDRVRVLAADRSYDLQLKVADAGASGLTMKPDGTR